MRSRAAGLFLSFLFLFAAPGTVAGVVPWAISRWRFDAELGTSLLVRAVGMILVGVGALALVECFLRFAWTGLGTPAPVAPPRRLVVTGLYRHVRNPMYVAIVAILFGQAFLFGQLALLGYAALVWLLFHLFVTVYEEPSLSRAFPGDYPRYREAVPRWIPRLTPWRGR